MEFSAQVQEWIERSGVTDDELCQAFDLSRASATRWRNGQCNSHPAVRDYIRGFFEARLRASPASP